MLRNWALLPLIDYSPSQLLTLAVCRLRVCAMSLRTFGKSSRFLLSIIVINFFDPLLASIPTRTRLLAFSQPKLVFLRPCAVVILSEVAVGRALCARFLPGSRGIPHRVCTLKIAMARIPPRIKIHRQRNPTLRIRSLWRNWNLNLGGVGPFLPCLLRCYYCDFFCLLCFLNSQN